MSCVRSGSGTGTEHGRSMLIMLSLLSLFQPVATLIYRIPGAAKSILFGPTFYYFWPQKRDHVLHKMGPFSGRIFGAKKCSLY